MWKCRRCLKAVYFAERKTSLGYDWHPECLRCEECHKRLNPGQHAEHKGVPYCHVPCYSVLFGPTLFGHGSRVESHKSFGNVEQRHGVPVPRPHLEAKLRIYNQFFDGKSSVLQSRERNGRLILEGSLRIYWGVNKMIHLKEDQDDRIPVRRRSSCRSFSEVTDMDLLKSLNSNERRSSVPSSDDGIGRIYNTLPAGGLKGEKLAPLEEDKENGIRPITLDGDLANVALRQHAGRKVAGNKLKRRCSINGHFYNRETSIFTPSHGIMTSVWVTSLVTPPEVINMLLEKFKVQNRATDFSLFVVRDTGEQRQILDSEYPLLVRVMLGPSEDVAKVFIMENKKCVEISDEVAQFLNLSDVELQAFIVKYKEEEEREESKIREKYKAMKHYIAARQKKLSEQKVSISSAINSNVFQQ